MKIQKEFTETLRAKKYKIKVRRPLFFANVRAKDESEARDKARKELFRRDPYLTRGMFRVEVYEVGGGLFMCHVFNLYFVEHLRFCDRILHLLYMLNATTFNIGVATEVVEIE